MPILTWTHKDTIKFHHKNVPFKILELKKEKSIINKTNEPINKIIQGDNLEALKSIMPEFEGSVDIIYIDPPYNTGNEGWRYNDNVTSPQMIKWLNEVVGKEGEDLQRHDKWLCMMYPRLKLLHQLLSDDGVIFISIDNIELANLTSLCDEIFNKENAIGTFIRQTRSGGGYGESDIGEEHDYILAYAKNRKNFKLNKIGKTESEIKKYYNHRDKNGVFHKRDLLQSASSDGTREKRPEMFFPILYKDDKVHSITKDEFEKIYNENTSTFDDEYLSALIKKYEKHGYTVFIPKLKNNLYGRWTQNFYKGFQKLLKKDDIFVDKRKNNQLKVYKKERYEDDDGEEKKKTFTTILKDSCFSNSAGTSELNMILNGYEFDYPKPSALIKALCSLHPNKNAIVLDSFAGSGTTGQAVLELNQRDGGKRQFILIEMNDYADSVTAERCRRTINGYSFEQENTSIHIPGTGGSFEYYELKEELFITNDYSLKILNPNIDLKIIRDYVLYTETGCHIKNYEFKNNKFYLDTVLNVDYYFIYDEQKNLSLTNSFLKNLDKNKKNVIYAAKCLISDEHLKAYNITFKKIYKDLKYAR